MKRFNVNPSDFYPNLKEQPYPEFYPKELNNHPLPEGIEVPFRQGDVLFDNSNNRVGIVLGTICPKDGELRLDSDGMQPIENLRFATIEDIEAGSGRIVDQLLEECRRQAKHTKTLTFQIKATIKKNITVEVDTEGMNENEIMEAGRQQAHEQFSPLNDGNEESYTEDSTFIEFPEA